MIAAARTNIISLLKYRIHGLTASTSTFVAAKFHNASAFASSATQDNQNKELRPPLDTHLGRLQMNSTERYLYRKHTKHLAIDQQRNMYDVVDSIEWNVLVTESLIAKALQWLSDPSFDATSLSDHEVAVLIGATGRSCQMLSPKRRIAKTTEMLNIFKKKGVRLGIEARNALLRVHIDNNVAIDPASVLKNIEADGLTPDVETYGQISRLYAQKTDVAGIIEIINHLKNLGFKTNSLLFESLVYAMAKLGQGEKAKTVIQHIPGDALQDKLWIAYASAKADSKDEVDMLDALKKVNDLTSDHLMSLYEILFKSVSRGDYSAVEKLKPLFPKWQEPATSNLWDFALQSRILRHLSGNKPNASAAALLLNFIENVEKRDKLHLVLAKYFSTYIRNCNDTAEVVRTCVIYQKSGIIRHPLRLYIQEISLNRPECFHDLFEIYAATEDFKEVENRPHLKLPIAARCLDELSRSQNSTKKRDLMIEVVRCLYSTGFEYCGERYTTNIKDMMVLPLLRDLSVLDAVIKTLDDIKLRCFVTDHLIAHLLETRRVDVLDKLLDGSLRKAIAGDNFPTEDVKSAVLESPAYSKLLLVSTRLIGLMFATRYEDGSQRKEAMQFIFDAVNASDMKKTRCICETLSKEGRVMLDEASQDALIKGLDGKGEGKKKAYVQWLSGKSRQTVKSDKKGNDSDIQQATHFVKKSISETVENEKASIRLKGMTLNATKMQEALDADDVEKAYETWKSRKDGTFPTSVMLRLAERLHALGRTDDCKMVLSKLKSRNEDMSRWISQTVKNMDREDFPIEFLKDAVDTLKLGGDDKRRLLFGVKKASFYRELKRGRLEEALCIVKEIANETKSVFGQIDLLGAAIDCDDMSTISEVLEIVKAHHGRESSLTDFCIALLEHGQKDQAMRLAESGSVRISPAKMSFYIDRELQSGRQEALFNLLELFVGIKSRNHQAYMPAISKIFRFYGRQKAASAIDIVEEKLKTIGFEISQDLKALVENVKSGESSAI